MRQGKQTLKLKWILIVYDGYVQQVYD